MAEKTTNSNLINDNSVLLFEKCEQLRLCKEKVCAELSTSKKNKMQPIIELFSAILDSNKELVDEIRILSANANKKFVSLNEQINCVEQKVNLCLSESDMKIKMSELNKLTCNHASDKIKELFFNCKHSCEVLSERINQLENKNKESAKDVDKKLVELRNSLDNCLKSNSRKTVALNKKIESLSVNLEDLEDKNRKLDQRLCSFVNSFNGRLFEIKSNLSSNEIGSRINSLEHISSVRSNPSSSHTSSNSGNNNRSSRSSRSSVNIISENNSCIDN